MMLPLFQHTAARRRLDRQKHRHSHYRKFQHTAARRRLDKHTCLVHICIHVSTHSRPKAAGYSTACQHLSRVGFNTQPPEGGWLFGTPCITSAKLFQHTAARRRLGLGLGTPLYCFGFQHTAARRRLESRPKRLKTQILVSTHSRPKAAGVRYRPPKTNPKVSTHSRPKAAGIIKILAFDLSVVSTHSRPKAAGESLHRRCTARLCFNTQPPEGGWRHRRDSACMRDRFNTQPPEGGWAIGATPRVCETVSTHSRPKAAGHIGLLLLSTFLGFNTQPPEGGWFRCCR